MQKNRLKESNNNDNSNNGKQVLKNSTFLNVSYIYSLRSNALIPYCGSLADRKEILTFKVENYANFSKKKSHIQYNHNIYNHKV